MLTTVVFLWCNRSYLFQHHPQPESYGFCDQQSIAYAAFSEALSILLFPLAITSFLDSPIASNFQPSTLSQSSFISLTFSGRHCSPIRPMLGTGSFILGGVLRIMKKTEMSEVQGTMLNLLI